MRVSVLILVLSLGSLVGWSRVAAAEKVKTNQSTKVYSRPGEHGKVLLKLSSGQNMTVLAREGRWIKVRVRGMTGYVPRSKVDEPDEGELVRNTRRRPFVDGRGTKRGFGGQGGPDDRIGADATVDRSDDGDGGEDGGDQGSASKGDKRDGDSDRDDHDEPSRSKAQAKAHAKHHGDSDRADGDDDGDSSDSDRSDDDDGGKARASSSKHEGSDDGDSDSDGDGDGDDAEPDDSKTGDPDEDKRPRAHVVAKTVAYEERSADSDANFTAKPDMVLYPSDKKGKWTFVEDDEGDAGWVLTSKLEMDGSSDEGSDDDGDGRARARMLDAGAGLGVTILQQALHTAGAPAPMQGTLNIDNYSIGTPTVSLALGGEALYPYSKRWMLGGAATLDYSKTLLGGISFPSSTASTGVSFMVFDLRAEAGYDLHKKNGMMVFGRLGYRYQSFAVDDYSNFMKNPAKLPQETLGAPTLGAALAIPKLTGKIGLSFSLDAILAGASIQQTKGLEDGASPSAKVFLVGGVFTYRWKKDMNLVGTYTLDYASIDFGKPVATSMRAHMGTDVTRTDLNHILTFGFTKGF